MSGERVPPALSADEWRDTSARLSRHEDVQADIGGEPPTLSVTVRRDRGRVAMGGIVDADRLPAVIALANAARADDDPGKLTWADVKVLGEASVIFRVGDVETATDERATARLRALAAKLAALLPEPPA